MIADIKTLIWKEWKEMFLQRGSTRTGLFNLLIIVGLMGVFMPLQMGKEWLSSPTGLLLWSWMPMFLVLGMVTDAFAGERERHTLETLLASRLEDGAILFGKIGAAVSYGWTFVLASMLLGAVTINIAFPEEGIRFYPMTTLVSGLGLSLLACTLIATLGVMVSLRAPTARAAYQRLSMFMLAFFLVPMVGMQVAPVEMRDKIADVLAGLNWNQLLVVIAVVLLVVDAGLIFLARSRFQRGKLIE
ncbi:MAG: ABC transporter permease [Anaerolineaceae bacterium]|nr:ABC transporter permease [Anaerolineaceae bacterium]